jgi:hypothetical protein
MDAKRFAYSLIKYFTNHFFNCHVFKFKGMVTNSFYISYFNTYYLHSALFPFIVSIISLKLFKPDSMLSII